MVEILLSLGGVIIGGAIGLGGTWLQTKNQRHIRQREEILPVASRALAAADETYQTITHYTIAVSISRSKGLKGEEFDKSVEDLEVDCMLSYKRLESVLEELSLLMRGIEYETEQLLKSLSQKEREGLLPWEHYVGEPLYLVFWDAEPYRLAREAFKERVREFLGTK